MQPCPELELGSANSPPDVVERGSAVLEELLLPVAKHRRPSVVLVADVVLTAADVVDLERGVIGCLCYSAVFTATMGPLPDDAGRRAMSAVLVTGASSE
jgi:hypothetical protein